MFDLIRGVGWSEGEMNRCESMGKWKCSLVSITDQVTAHQAIRGQYALWIVVVEVIVAVVVVGRW